MSGAGEALAVGAGASLVPRVLATAEPQLFAPVAASDAHDLGADGAGATGVGAAAWAGTFCCGGCCGCC